MLLKNAFLLALIVLSLAIFSCGKSEQYDRDVQLQLDIDSIGRYVAKNKIDVTKDASGIYYKIIRQGTGTAVLEDFDTISVSYTGKMLNDSTIERVIDSAKLVIYTLPEGFRKGLQIKPAGASYGVQKGGQIRFIVPSVMAYINRPVYTTFPIGIIPPNSNLDYTVQLLNIYKKKK